MLNVVIYERPLDYPYGYVVRRWNIIQGNPDPQPHPEAYPFRTLLDARTWVEHMHPELVDLGADPEDPKIVAVYL